MRSGRGRILALVAMALTACSANPPPPAPLVRPTIVSLNPCSDAILAEVANPGQLLAISHYSHDPRSTSMDIATARRFAATSGTVEEIVALNPDVVVASTFLQPAAVQALERLDIPLLRLPIAASVDDSAAQVRALARLAGQAERGEALVARIDQALDAAAPPPGSQAVTAVVWQGGGLVAGSGTLIDELLKRAGFANFSAARGLGQGAILPLEAVLADPPAVILAAGGSPASEDRLLDHPVLDELGPATRRAEFAPDLLFCGGPTIVRAAQRLAQVRRDGAGSSE